MDGKVQIRLMQPEDILVIAAAFDEIGWDKPASQYERYLAEQNEGSRDVLVALESGVFAGYVTIGWQSKYPPFREDGIPEIVDLNVLPRFRRRGIGTALMDVAERRMALRSPLAGIAVGMYADYGAAQRMYVLRGYVPDGRGLFYGEHPVRPGEQVRVDDDLLLFFTKQLVAN